MANFSARAARCGRRSRTRCSPTTSGPRRSGPIRPGQHLAAGEDRDVHDDARQADQDEANRLAREFRPSGWDLRYYDDDTWIKNHADDPRAQELYRAAQRNSITLRDRGTQVGQDDLRPRAAAGAAS